MALILCKECGTEVSDTAAACVKCGAVIPRTIREGEEQCPFCMTIISSNATTCPSCKAVKGYMYESRYGAMGKVGVTIWSVIFPLLLTFLFYFRVPQLSVLAFLWALYGIFRLVTGPRWFQTKHAPS